jgi:acetyl esterase/lipase
MASPRRLLCAAAVFGLSSVVLVVSSAANWRPAASLPPLHPQPQAWLERLIATVVGSGRSVINYLDHDARPGLASVCVPVFAVWGASDPTVPVNQAVRTLIEDVPGSVSMHILPGAGHDVPISSGYLERAAMWMLSGGTGSRGPKSVRGAEPETARAVGRLPDAEWYTNPLLHSLVSLGLAAAAFAWVRPRSSRRGSR